MTLRALSTLLDFNGRMSGPSYHGLSFANVVGLLLSFSLFVYAIGLVGWWASPLILLPVAAATASVRQRVRRMHDLGHSGYWLLIPAAGWAGGIGLYVLGPEWLGLAPIWAALILSLIFEVPLGFRGTVGPDPKATNVCVDR